MSLKALKSENKKNNDETFGSVLIEAKHLSTQCGRILTVIDSLKKKPNLIQYDRVQKNLVNVSDKLTYITKWYSRLEEQMTNPGDPAIREIHKQLSNIRRDYKKMQDLTLQLKDAHVQLQQEELRRAEEEKKKREQTLKQLEIERNEQEAIALEKGAEEIASDMKGLNDLTNELNTHLDDQHETIGRVENTISDAHKEMTEGNKELETAETHQKETPKILCWILWIIVCVLGVAGIILGLVFGLR